MALRVLFVTLIAVLILPTATLATSVQPGIDPVDHLPPSWWDFGPVPLPADFFGPGSDPFDGGIPGDQTALPPIPECPGDLGNTSMLIERLDVAVLPTIPSSDVIDTEIIALSLVSNNPITVTYNGGLNPEAWDVEITLSPTSPSIGLMTVSKTHANGGTFDAEITLQPYFTFTRVSDSTVRTLDGAGLYHDMIATTDVPWVYEDPELACPSCSSNFIPGHNGLNAVEFSLTGTLSQHTLKSSCPSAAIPTLSQWGLALVVAILLTLGVCVIARRRTAQVQASRSIR